MKVFCIYIILFCSFAYGEEFTMICEGERTVRSFSNSELNDLDFESVLLKIKKNSMEYIGLNSGRSYVFSNKEYTAPKRPPHEDIKIKVLYEFTQKTIKASQIITDIGNSEESSISRFSLSINRLTGNLSEIENVSNKKTLQKSISNNFQAICEREDKLY